MQSKMKTPERWRPSRIVPSVSVLYPCDIMTLHHMTSYYMTKWTSTGKPPQNFSPYYNCSAGRVLTDRQTYRHTDGTDSIPSTAHTGGKKCNLTLMSTPDFSLTKYWSADLRFKGQWWHQWCQHHWLEPLVRGKALVWIIFQSDFLSSDRQTDGRTDRQTESDA